MSKIVRLSGNSPTTTKPISNRNIIGDLKARALRPALGYWIFGEGTVSRLGQLSEEKYQSYLRLFDFIKSAREEAVGNTMKSLPLLKLMVPPVAELNEIDVDFLLADEKAKREILHSCYSPEEGKVDLRFLHSIFARFRLLPPT